MWHQGSEWATFVNLADDPALDAGGLEADDFLAQFLAEPGMADAVAKVRRKVGEAQASEVGCGLLHCDSRQAYRRKSLASAWVLQPRHSALGTQPHSDANGKRHGLLRCHRSITMQEFHDAIRQTKDQTAAA